jgi:polysaccharide pyruvyl transferase WcaK-like protein
LSVRDVESQKICQSWGLNEVRKKTDACYLKDLWMDDGPIQVQDNNLGKSIGMVIRHWPHTDIGSRYIHSMLSAAQELRKIGIYVQFISLDYKYDAPILSILKSQNEMVKIYDPSNTTPGQFMRRVASKFQLIVSSRAHGIILPAVLGLPGVCVGIEPKLRNVHLSLPTGTSLWSEPFNPDELVNIIKIMVDKLEEYSHNIQKEADENNKIAKEESQYFVNWLKLAYVSS